MYLRGSVKVARLTTRLPTVVHSRNFSGDTDRTKRGLVVGAYIDQSGDNVKLTPAADQINQETDGAITKALKISRPTKMY